MYVWFFVLVDVIIVRLLLKIEVIVYFIVVEVLINVVWYVCVDCVYIIVDFDGSMFCFEICDDGVGGVWIDKGMGLFGF